MLNGPPVEPPFIADAAAESTANPTSTILIVDDNPDILMLMSLHLRHAGFNVLQADTGQRALDVARREKPDIILLDVLMPEMNGFEACEALKSSQETADIPIIFLTALSDTVNKVKGFKLGAVDYISKPPQNEEVTARINTHLTLRRLQRELKAQNHRLQEENIKRQRVQDALRESRERYRILADNATDIISHQTPEGVYRYVSPACITVLGYPVVEMVGKRELDFVHPQDVAAIQAVLDQINTRPEKLSYTYRAMRKDGEFVWLETTSTLIRDAETGLPAEIISVARNVTDRKEAEEALQRAHDQLEIRVQQRTAELVLLNRAYQRFVPHEFLRYMNKSSITEVQLGDQARREMTIFCSDLRNFTSLSERLGPKSTFNFLNTYFSRISPIIRQFDGFVDKYIGDAVMALFPNNPADAIQAAIEIQKEILLLNEDLQKHGYPTIGSGTGIHTGSLMLGTIGETERMESTVISDSVNLAFRLEGLTKLYGARVVISDRALFSMKTPTMYRFRFLDRVRVKGKEEPVSVFEIFDGDSPELAALKQKTLLSFEKGLLHYHSQEFEEAHAFFQDALAQNPADRAAELYCKRAAHFAEYGVPPGWEGIEALSSK